MKDDLKNNIEKHSSSGGFIKVSDSPVSSLTSEQKVQLNRRGNMLFNKGDIKSAQRLFITTGYSDGLTRVGDIYQKRGDDLAALKLYLLAHNKRKSECVLEKIASIVSLLLKDEDVI